LKPHQNLLQNCGSEVNPNHLRMSQCRKVFA